MGLTIRFGKDDKDLAEYFASIEQGAQSKQAKHLMRLGLAVQGINFLEQLIDKGIVAPLEVSVTSDKPQKEKGVGKKEEEEFLSNLASSWDLD